MVNKRKQITKKDNPMPVYSCEHYETPKWDGKQNSPEDLGFFATLFGLLLLPIILVWMLFYAIFGKEPTPEEEAHMEAQRKWLAEHRMNYG